MYGYEAMAGILIKMVFMRVCVCARARQYSLVMTVYRQLMTREYWRWLLASQTTRTIIADPAALTGTHIKRYRYRYRDLLICRSTHTLYSLQYTLHTAHAQAGLGHTVVDYALVDGGHRPDLGLQVNCIHCRYTCYLQGCQLRAWIATRACLWSVEAEEENRISTVQDLFRLFVEEDLLSGLNTRRCYDLSKGAVEQHEEEGEDTDFCKMKGRLFIGRGCYLSSCHIYKTYLLFIFVSHIYMTYIHIYGCIQ